MTEKAGGGCMCGAVSYEVDGPMRSVMNCHCDRCRRFTGHFMAATSASLDDVVLSATTADALRWFEASDGVFYGFCGTCGSSLFWRNDDEPDRWSITAGSVEPPTGLETTLSIWTAHASDYHGPIAGATHDFD